MKHLLFIFLLISSGAFAQPMIEWDKTISNGDSSELIYHIEQTHDGGYIMTGRYGNTGSNNGYNVYLVKLDAFGDTLWTKKHGGPFMDYGKCVKQCFDKGFVIGGRTNPVGTPGSEEFYLIKTDSVGNLEWQNHYGSASCNDFLNYVDQTADSGFVLSGGSVFLHSVSGDCNEFDSPTTYVVKTDKHGNLVWEYIDTSHSNSSDRIAYSAKQTPDGGFIVGGRVDDGVVNKCQLTKLDAGGGLEWMTTYGPGTINQTVQLTSEGFVFFGSAGSDPGTFWRVSELGDSILANTSSDLNWGSIRASAEGGYIVMGGGESDPKFVKLDEFGNTDWVFPLPTPLSYLNASDFTATADSAYVLSLRTMTPTSNFSVRVLKIKNQGTNGIQQFQKTPVINVWPNPIKSVARCVLPPEIYQAGVEMKLLDMLGNTVRTFKALSPEFVIEKESLSPGAYFLQVEINKQLLAQKIIIY